MSTFTVFSGLSRELEPDPGHSETNPWERSPFYWFSAAASGRKGAVGKKLVRLWAEREGMQVASKVGRGHDFQIDGLRVAVRVSLVWADGGFAFEQIRDQSVDVMSLLALEPQNARLWIVPKEVLRQSIGGQHTGAAGRETKWLKFQAAEPPPWLQAYGGTLPRARQALEQARDELSG
jgi:hypothetical protein